MRDEDWDPPLIRLADLALAAPRLPSRRRAASAVSLATSIALHVAAASMLLLLADIVSPPSEPLTTRARPDLVPDVSHIVFIAREPPGGGGGGGGGNRQAGPIRRAQAVGADKITLRTAKTKPLALPTPEAPVTPSAPDVPALPELVLDARPLASGTFDQIGLPEGGVPFGTSTGTGSGGGVGDGTGTGIGAGTGPGFGPGSGGGIGGGTYRPGGAVTTPRVITEVKPKYTDWALRQKIQGSIVLELVVKKNGEPSGIQVVRSLDPGGLDEQAILAASQWRFEPGRLAGTPVDVLVTLVLDFSIR